MHPLVQWARRSRHIYVDNTVFDTVPSYNSSLCSCVSGPIFLAAATLYAGGALMITPLKLLRTAD